VTLPAAVKSAFVLQILSFLLDLTPASSGDTATLSSEEAVVAVSRAQYIAALLGSVLVFLDKASPVFGDVGASDGVLQRCADFALRSYRSSAHTSSITPLRSELGASQLVALITNKVLSAFRLPHLSDLPAAQQPVICFLSSLFCTLALGCL
jgi:hypothetical protein